MIRLYLIIIFFLISLLAIFKAPAYYLWFLAIAVTEFPLIFAGITVLLISSGIWFTKYQLTGNIIGVVALVLFISPVIRAYLVAESMEQNLDIAFGPDKFLSRSPFTFSKLSTVAKNTVAYETLNYVSYSDITLTLDFYHSQITGKKPCLIVVHGGSWSSGDSKQLPELNSYLAKAGYNVASINYRMAPKHQNPAPVKDIQAALSYLRLHAEGLKIDTDKFVLLGRSAGAQIALLAAYTLHDSGLKGVIDFYGPADMVWGYSIPSNPLIMDSRAVMESYLDGSYQKAPQNYLDSSPIEFVDQQSIPTLIIHGHNDVLVAYEHSRRLNEKLQKNGIKHYWLKLPWATHGFDFNLNGPGGQLSTYAVEHFLYTVTK